MPIETEIWRRLPVRGAGRLVIPGLERRAARGPVIAPGPFGTRIAVDPDNAEEVSVYLWGTCAPEVESALARVIVPGEACLDVGAGTGVFSAIIGVLNRPGRVLAVERSPGAAQRIARHADLNATRIEVLGCDPLALDASLPSLDGDRVQLLRISPGGREPAILRGAQALLRASRPVLIFDWCPDGWAVHGETPGATVELLREMSYEVFLPAIRPQGRWSVRPAALERFSPAPLSALPMAGQPGSYVVALPPTASRAASQLSRPR